MTSDSEQVPKAEFEHEHAQQEHTSTKRERQTMSRKQKRPKPIRKGVSITAEQGGDKTSPAVLHLSTESQTPHRESDSRYHEGMALEWCKVCGERVRTMAYRLSGACCQRCLERLDEISCAVCRDTFPMHASKDHRFASREGALSHG